MPSNDFIGGDKKWADFVDSEVASVSDASSRLGTNSLASQKSANAVTGNYSQLVNAYQVSVDNLASVQDNIEAIARYKAVNWFDDNGKSIAANQSFTFATVTSTCPTGTLEIGYCLNWYAAALANALHFRVKVNDLEVLNVPNGESPYDTVPLVGTLRVGARSSNSIAFLATGDAGIPSDGMGVLNGLYAYVRSVY